MVGGGLAGCTAAWALRWRGAGVRLFDRGGPSATRAAAGIVNPITGPNLTLEPDFRSRWAEALAFYRRVEAESGQALFHPMPLVRLFDSERQSTRWRRRLDAPGYRDIAADLPEPPASCDGEFGGFEVATAGFLDTRALMDATRGMLGDAWERVEVPPGEIAARSGGGMQWVFCEGAAAQAGSCAPDAPFAGFQFRPARGEILTVQSFGAPGDRIVNRGGAWLVPLGGGRFRAGATYDWDDLASGPTGSGRDEIETKLRRWLRAPFEVVDHQAGVRPILAGRQIRCGPHPTLRHLWFFNGLGSKGTLRAPGQALELAERLV